jgi:hypothetical protein
MTNSIKKKSVYLVQGLLLILGWILHFQVGGDSLPTLLTYGSSIVVGGYALFIRGLGIAMGGAGTDTALETADIALMVDDLTKLPFTIKLSRKS